MLIIAVYLYLSLHVTVIFFGYITVSVVLRDIFTNIYSYVMLNLICADCHLYLFRVHSLHRTALSEKYFRDLPKHHQQLLPSFCEHLAAVRTCIEHNFEIIKLLIADTDNMFENRLDYYDTVSILIYVIILYFIFYVALV